MADQTDDLRQPPPSAAQQPPPAGPRVETANAAAPRTEAPKADAGQTPQQPAAEASSRATEPASQTGQPKADGERPGNTPRSESPRADSAGDQVKQAAPPAGTRELLDTLALSFGQVSQADRSTAQAIKSIVQQGGDTGQHADPAFRHQLAYVVQDTEKALRGPIAMPAELRIEMFERAGSAPGLENERMQALMRSTSGISDRILVRDIRSAGIELGSYGDQNLPGATSNIETLENRVRLTARTPDLTPTPEQGANTSRTPSSEQRNDDGRNNRSDTQQQTPAQVVIHRTAADVLIDSMRGMLRGARDVTDNPPWEPEHTPMKARFEAYEARLQAERDGKSVARAEQNGQAALDALNGFQNNEGAGIMSRIREAARNNPGGLEGVLSEMKPGGRFADLRAQFTAALDHDHGFAAAYDKAATALAQYDKSRTGVDPIIARAPEADKLAARFEGLDAKIGEAASLVPGKQDGKSMVEDLSKMIGDIFQRAVDGVRGMFNRAAGADATARPGPSPGMS